MLWVWACITLFTGCSTRRNTTATRAYHELTTRYNIYFNAEEAYHEILRERAENSHENYGELLPFYPSLPDAEKSPSGGIFDPVIEKTEKAIREHSITAKPRRNPAKAHSQEYRQWLRQEEFNPFLKNVWMLRGKAFLQNGDYDNALTVFSGMLRQFGHDPDLVNETQIWMLRTYTEMERTYEAEKTAYALSNKKLPMHLERLFTEHYTYFLIRKKEFPEAIPPLQKTIAGESDLLTRKRLQFLLGQIYAMTGENDKALRAFEEVKGLRTPPELASNATLWQSAIANDSLAQVFRPSEPDNNAAGKVTATVTLATDSIAGNMQHSQNTHARLSDGRTLAENAALHRQWRSRNGLWQSPPTGSAEGQDGQVIPFSPDKNGLHYLLLTFTPGSIDKNQLLFTIADFNFSHFKLRGFNLSYIYLPGAEALQIEPFRSFEEASRYTGIILSDSLFLSAIMETTPVIISEGNARLMQSGKKLDEYNAFYQENMATAAVTFPSIIKDERIEIKEKRDQEQEKIVSLEASPVTIPEQKEISSPPQPPYQADQTEGITSGEKTLRTEPARQIERETPESLKRKLEENAAKALQQEQGTASRKNREQLIKEREREREARIRQREQELKERQRKREAALKQRERERARKIRK
ncbi:hypothetical protein D7D25_04015 [Proteiniphilum sp. X52]|nr:hypothetical protein D7D25_04015 [Proteiniphilum sp. X52]